MILTQQTAQRLLSSHLVVQVLPEMLTYVEQFARMRSSVVQNGGCRSCKERAAAAPVLRQALQFITGLAPDRLEILKAFLKTSKLFTYIPQAGGKPGLVELVGTK